MNEVAVQNNALATKGDAYEDDLSNKDILIPTLNLMHDISQLVKDRKSLPGSIVSSNMNEVLTEPGQSVEIIAFKPMREWIVNEVDARGKKVAFIGKFPVTKANENWSKEAIENGKPIERIYCLNFFCVLPKDLNALPHIVSFRKSGLRTGKQLATHFTTCKMARAMPYAKVFKLGSKQNTWQGNTFWVLDIEPSRAATDAEFVTAKKWRETLQEAEAVHVLDEESADEAPRF